ncbi:MAG: DRTGG domain-containing protein [Syntrophorhabdaceae bacterium]|nr:DRTGG domain-containing protein [Syntrophorhabdaceae bacterium]
MKVRELVSTLNLEVLTKKSDLEREIKGGYVSDLLSDVIANMGESYVWVTIQRHINILGVAKLKDVAAIVIPRNLTVGEEVIERAEEENIPILRTEKGAFEIVGLIFNALKG